MTEPDMAAIDQALAVLNRIHKADPSVLPTLIAHRVSCNQAVADDPSVQVGKRAADDGWEVGFLGIINGLFGVDASGWGYIAASFNKDHSLEGFAFFKAPVEGCSVCGLPDHSAEWKHAPSEDTAL
ncbi:MAG: hypothetical protein V4472_25025 [Pseudomonadota bacterium]